VVFLPSWERGRQGAGPVLGSGLSRPLFPSAPGGLTVPSSSQVLLASRGQWVIRERGHCPSVLSRKNAEVINGVLATEPVAQDKSNGGLQRNPLAPSHSLPGRPSTLAPFSQVHSTAVASRHSSLGGFRWPQQAWPGLTHRLGVRPRDPALREDAVTLTCPHGHGLSVDKSPLCPLAPESHVIRGCRVTQSPL
jgi:hypothetical protein